MGKGVQDLVALVDLVDGKMEPPKSASGLGTVQEFAEEWGKLSAEEACDFTQEDHWLATCACRASFAKAMVEAAARGDVIVADGDWGRIVVFGDYVALVTESAGLTHVTPFKKTSPEDLERSHQDFFDIASGDEAFEEEDEAFSIEGDAETLTRVISDIILTSDAVPKGSNCVMVTAEADGEAEVRYTDGEDLSAWYESSERDALLFEHVLVRFQPTGHTWEYNDGDVNRMSGYDRYPGSMEIDFDERKTSALLRAVERAMLATLRDEARERLVAWLRETDAHPDLVAATLAEAGRTAGTGTGAREALAA